MEEREMNEKELAAISLHELTQLTTYCLNVLSCTDELRGNENLKDAYEQAKTLEGSIRKLKIASLMEKRTLICVSGMQGAGKTTMIKNFYGLKTENLNICLGRGERIPVMITEKDIQEPLMQASVIERGENGTYTVTDREMEPEEFAKASAGGDGSILYLELCVPYRHLNNSGVSFVLLPGFEKKNDYWKTLIEFAVNSSDAAIFVFDESSFSQADNYEQLRQLKDRFGENIIYAITRSDSSADDNAAVKKTCMEALEIPQSQEDRVVCTGQYEDLDKNNQWIEKMKRALDRYAYYGMEQKHQNIRYLNDEVEKIGDTLYEILEIIKADDSAEIEDHQNDTLLAYYDRAVQKQRNAYAAQLDMYFNKGKAASCDNIKDGLNRFGEKLRSVKKIFTGVTLNDMENARRNVEESLVDHTTVGQGEPLFIPDQCVRNALGASLRKLEDPCTPKSLKLLVAGERKNGKKLLQETNEKNIRLKEDICTLIADPSQRQMTYSIKTRNTRNLMEALAEMATYYFAVMNYDTLSEKCGAEGYEPCENMVEQEHVAGGAQTALKFSRDAATMAAGVKEMGSEGKEENSETKNEEEMSFKDTTAITKFAIGLGSMTGMDLVGDGTINMIPQIARAFRVSVPVVAVGAVAAVGAGATIATVSDISRMQFEDYRRAKTAVGSIYDTLEENALNKYDEQMERVRQNIENNICDLNGEVKNAVVEYDAKIQINAALNLLHEISGRMRRMLV